MNICLHIAFDGTNYCGFQVQPNGRSVCETLQDALEAVLGKRVPVKGCSRTDSGVHALDYVLNFHTVSAIPPARLPLALNAHLPADIRVRSAAPAAEDFHARYSAHSKTYCYYLWNSAIDDPFRMKYHHRVSGRLDLAAMQAAAAAMVGTHDFTSLCAAHSSVLARGDTVRTVFSCTVAQEGEQIAVTVTADGYLYNMVRILAGTLLEAGQGKRSPESIGPLLAARSRAQAGPTLPACGLFLTKVEYRQEMSAPLRAGIAAAGRGAGEGLSVGKAETQQKAR